MPTQLETETRGAQLHSNDRFQFGTLQRARRGAGASGVRLNDAITILDSLRRG